MSMHVPSGQMSVHPLGAGRDTLSPGDDFETDCMDCESQRKSLRNSTPLSFKGSRAEMDLSSVMSAFSTPTEKKANALDASPSCTRAAAACQGSDGAPS